MKRVLICDTDAVERTRFRAAVERYAQEQKISNVEVVMAVSPESMSERLQGARKGLYYMVACRVQDEGAYDALRQLRQDDSEIRIVLVSTDVGDAIHAFELQAGFFLIPNDFAGFVKAIGEPLAEVVDRHAATFAVKSPQGIKNIYLGDILFAESAKKGPIIHLPGSRTVAARGTLQSLYERLSSVDGERFMKVGGSFIVNLDNVRSAGESSLIFCDGEAVIVPVRMRKPMKEALASYRRG